MVAGRPVSSLSARLFAAVHHGTPGDAPFYAAQCEGARRVLELGCGAGRLLPILAGIDPSRDATAGARARDVVGIDLDEDALGLARARIEALGLRPHVTVQHGDMRGPLPAGGFDRVVIPFNGLWCLEGEPGIRRCLHAAAAALDHGGRLAFDVYDADEFHETAHPDDLPEDEAIDLGTLEVDGVTWRVNERSRWDREAQRIVATYVHERLDDPGAPAIEIAITHAYVRSSVLLSAVGEAGLTLESVQRRFRPDIVGDDDVHAVVARRP